MTIGVQTFNTQGNISIDETSISYVYLGKYALTGFNQQTIDITCVGYPLIFFEVPYGKTDDANPNSTNYNDCKLKWGSAVRKVESVGTNTWRVYFILNYGNGSSYSAQTMYIRVFGKLADNYPAGSGERYGFRVFSSDGKLAFDSGFKMFSLAGNTYDTEIALRGENPNYGETIGKYDTSIVLPFSMANKSICANVRGVTFHLYNTGSYDPFDGDPTPMNTYDGLMFESLYSATGSTLMVRRVATDWNYQEYRGTVITDTSNANTTYTRLAVIDNTKFP